MRSGQVTRKRRQAGGDQVDRDDVKQQRVESALAQAAESKSLAIVVARQWHQRQIKEDARWQIPTVYQDRIVFGPGNRDINFMAMLSANEWYSYLSIEPADYQAYRELITQTVVKYLQDNPVFRGSLQGVTFPIPKTEARLSFYDVRFYIKPGVVVVDGCRDYKILNCLVTDVVNAQKSEDRLCQAIAAVNVDHDLAESKEDDGIQLGLGR